MAYADYRKTRVKRSEEEKTERSISHVRHLIKKMPERCLNNFEDYIEFLVGTRGLLELIKHGCLESCGVVNGRKLYVLVDRGD